MAALGSVQQRGRRSPQYAGIVGGLLVGLLLGALVLAPHSTRSVAAKLAQAEEHNLSLQTELDKLQAEKDAAVKQAEEVRSGQAAVRQELEVAQQAAKECQERSLSSDSALADLKQKLAGAQAQLQEATQQLQGIGG